MKLTVDIGAMIRNRETTVADLLSLYSDLLYALDTRGRNLSGDTASMVDFALRVGYNSQGLLSELHHKGAFADPAKMDLLPHEKHILFVDGKIHAIKEMRKRLPTASLLDLKNVVDAAFNEKR